MVRGIRTFFVVAVLFAILTTSHRCLADDTPAGASEAQKAFKEGAELVEAAEWSAAILAFERSRAAREHALTLYNIGVCQRFLGRYTLARETFKAALARGQSTGEMSALFIDQGNAYLKEIEGKLARFSITLEPKSARVAIEGRPLTPSPGQPNVFVAGTAESGEGKPLELTRFEVLVDPRPMVLTFSLDGYDTIELPKNPKGGSHEEVSVSMSQQPSQLKVASNVPGAVVRVDGVDVGLTPVLVSRPPGIRVVSVTHEGYVPYESKLTLPPGKSIPIDARLEVEKVPVTKKWWFWTASGVALVGVGLLTYFIVRPAPERPDPNAGGLGWLAEVR